MAANERLSVGKEEEKERKKVTGLLYPVEWITLLGTGWRAGQELEGKILRLERGGNTYVYAC